jgi:hypothetical protein
MANISAWLTKIASAIYGRDVRDALHNSIKAVNTDVENIKTATGKPNGYATLDSYGKVLQTQLPNLSIIDTFVVNSQAAMLALNAQKGDLAVRTDLSKTFVLKASPANSVSNWQELLTPPDRVLSVAGKTGNVIVTKADVGLGNADNTADDVKNVLSARKLTTARTINGVRFDGTSDITIVDSSKEPSITAGTVNQFWRGDKHWADLASAVKDIILIGLSTDINAEINAEDSILTAIGKLQAQITDCIISNLELQTTAHMHGNKPLLDSLTEERLEQWDNMTSDDSYIIDLIGGLMYEIESLRSALGITIYDGGLFGMRQDGAQLDGGLFEDTELEEFDCGGFEVSTVMVSAVLDGGSY